MYAQCPLCQAIFRLNAAQLGAARGSVRCGSCHEVFDALQNLRDDTYVEQAAIARSRGIDGQDTTGEEDSEPGSARVPAVGPSIDATRAAEPTLSDPALGAALVAQSIPGATVQTRQDADGPVASLQVSHHTAPTGRLDQGSGAPPLLQATDGFPIEPLRAGPAPVGLVLLPDPDARLARPFADVIPESIRDDMQRQAGARAARRRFAWRATASVVLALALAAQHVWFNPVDTSRDYPQWHASIERFCELTECVLPVRREPNQVRVLNRDVRVHPRYEGALQVTATLINDAPFSQPYPHMSFTLFNVNGQTIAARIFSPQEYLNAPLAPSAMFASGAPLQVAIELLAPGDVAVSFEFRFL